MQYNYQENVDSDFIQNTLKKIYFTRLEQIACYDPEEEEPQVKKLIELCNHEIDKKNTGEDEITDQFFTGCSILYLIP